MTAELTARRGEKLLVVTLVFAGFTAGYACTYASVSTTFILPLTKAFGWGRLVPAFMYLAAMFGVVSASLVLGSVIRRFGEARVAAGSGLCLAVIIASHALLAGSVPVAIGLAYLAGLLGAGTGVGLYVALMPRWFDADLGRALGCAVMGQSFGSAIMPAISAGMIATWGWRNAYLVLASITLLVTLLVAAILSVLLSKRFRDTADDVAPDGIDVLEARRLSSYRLLQLSAFLQAFAMFGVSFHIFPIYADLGLDWSVLPRITIALAAGLAIGRILSGLLLDLVEARLVAVGMYGTGACAVAWLATLSGTPGTIEMYLPPLLVGAAMGSESDILAYFVRRLFGRKHYPAIYNRQLAAYFLGSMSGPLILGWTFDRMDTPRSGLWVLALAGCLAALVSVLLPRVRSNLATDVAMASKEL